MVPQFILPHFCHIEHSLVYFPPAPVMLGRSGSDMLSHGCKSVLFSESKGTSDIKDVDRAYFKHLSFLARIKKKSS